MNFKNQLQELCQKRRLSIPKYDLVEYSGQSHCPVVVIRVTVNWDGEQLVEEARGEGMKRKDVEKKAAQQMYQRIYDTKLSSTRPVRYVHETCPTNSNYACFSNCVDCPTTSTPSVSSCSQSIS